ncbi:MAG: chloride channel protein, partial [Ilumatobacteraceae bacterium]
MVTALAVRHEELLEYRHDSNARRAWLQRNGEHPFMSCPACGQWGRYGLCEWCDFDATDYVAVAAVHAHRNARVARDDIPDSDGRAPLVHCRACGQLTRPPICTWCDHELPATIYEDAPALTGLQLQRSKAYALARGMVRLDVVEQLRLIAYLLRWIALGAAVGVLAGLSSAGFLQTLTWATNLRLEHGWMLFVLPLGGLVVGLAYHHFGGRSGEGNSLIIDEIHDPSGWVPRRMAPLVFGGTVITHLFGGSAGREGTAIQMSGSLTDGFSRLIRLGPDDRRLMLIAALGGGFGAVFGVPIAGCVFALEVQAVGRMRYDALIPALSASLIGDLVVRATGVKHALLPQLVEVHVTVGLAGKVAIAGLAFGLASIVFSELVHGIKRALATIVSWPPARPLVGGIGVIGLTYLVGTRDYLGLSIPLITKATAGGAGIVAGAFALKLLFTAITLGAGFQGGEVTPLFVIGATLGVTMGRLLGVPIPLMAAIGFVAVFAGATNTPLACTVMGVELFGGSGVVLFAIGCVVSYIFSS